MAGQMSAGAGRDAGDQPGAGSAGPGQPMHSKYFRSKWYETLDYQ
jgi:hypothetical protein